jgi:vitamin B12/bleomycin/antimicrobial peptide transport system ATP-binding/permease protein
MDWGRGMSATTTTFAPAIWRLIRPYWVSEERAAASGLLALVIWLNLATVYISVRLNAWNAQFFDAIQAKQAAAFMRLLLVFAGWAAALIVCAVYALYVSQMLQIRWRRWLTERYLHDWLDHHVYYRLQLTGGGTDNPDQRIADDLRLFVDMTLSLSLGLIRATVTVVSFLGILWALSGSLSFRVAGIPVRIGGYLVWAAVGYAVVGTWATHRIGAPLARLNYDQQRFEADLRYSLARFRDNVEGVALYGGELEEHRHLTGRFQSVMHNWWAIMRRQKRLTWFTAGYGQIAIIFPYLAVAPRYFSGAILLGGLTQTADAFGTLQGSLSWFVDAYGQLAEWKATVDRLDGFQQAVRCARLEMESGSGVLRRAESANVVTLTDVSLRLPDGRRLLEGATMQLSSGAPVLITGPSGAGKSTVFRALAGIWPFGEGAIGVPARARLLFLPQKPYVPLGTLREVVTFPATGPVPPDAALEDLLRACGLAHLAGRLGEARNWAAELSGGEQQRVAFCRVLIVRPQWLFMDEASSALDEAAEASLYRLLRQRLPNMTIVSIGHHASLEAIHTRHLTLTPVAGGSCMLAPAVDVALGPRRRSR